MATLAIAVHFGDHSYDGPFDALFTLIRYHDYPIDALPIARLTADFLAYIRNAKDLDEDLGAEFMEVASWLVLLKSRAILPVDAFTGTAISPQQELRKVLIDRKKIDAVTEELKGRAGSKAQLPVSMPVGRNSDAEVDSEPTSRGPTVQDALEAAQTAMALARTRRYAQNEDTLSVEDAQSWVMGELGALPCFTLVSTKEWFRQQADAGSRAALLLGLLELARAGRILLHQHEPGAPIQVKALSLEPPCTGALAAQGGQDCEAAVFAEAAPLI